MLNSKSLKIRSKEKKYEERLKEINPLLVHYSKYKIRGMDSEDIAQELRIHLWQVFNQYDKKKSIFNTWANKVLRNKVIDLTRRKKDTLDCCLYLEEVNEKNRRN